MTNSTKGQKKKKNKVDPKDKCNYCKESGLWK